MINETHNPEQDEQKRFFKEVAEKIKNGENRERSLEDPCCLITFILIVLTTFIIGVVVMSTQDRPLSHESTTQTK